jgi:hypothetical protein
MSYIGNTPVNQNFVAGADQFSGTGSQTVFTLSRNVNTVFDIFVTVSNVPQDPFTAYTVAGNTLTFDGAPPSGTNNIDVVYRATNVQTFVPSPGVSPSVGNLNFIGTGNRITGDFSNATVANRVNFQTSTLNNGTYVSTLPNGTDTNSGFFAYNATNGDNAAFIGTYLNNSLAIVNSGKNGTGTYLPMTFYTGGSEAMRIDTSRNVGIGLTPVGTGLLELKAGTTSVAPLEFNAGTNTTSAVAGAVEYDGRVFYATPQGTQRGVVPGAQFFRLNAGLVGANVNTAQSVFGVGVTLSASTVYAFEAVFSLTKTAGTTSHSIGFLYGGTATLNNFYMSTMFNPAVVASGLPSGGAANISATNAATTLTLSTATTSATATYNGRFTGTVSINAGGTFIPQYILSAAPGGAYTTVAGSYFLIYPIGASGANTSVGTWA